MSRKGWGVEPVGAVLLGLSWPVALMNCSLNEWVLLAAVQPSLLPEPSARWPHCEKHLALQSQVGPWE